VFSVIGKKLSCKILVMDKVPERERERRGGGWTGHIWMEMGTGEFLSVFSRIVTRFCSAKLHFGPVKLIRVSLMYVYFEISQ
jgi:hypothetical protein